MSSLDAPSITARSLGVNPPAASIRQSADALGAALRLVAAGWGVVPVRADTKTPARAEWQHPAVGAVVAALEDPKRRANAGYTTDAATVRAWWGPGGRYAKCGVGIALRDAGAFAIDLDDEAAADGWRAMVEAGGGIGATFTIHSAKGAKVIMRRDGSPVPLDANGNKTRVPTFAGCTDVVAGYVLAWARGRRWEGSPDVVAACPEWLHAPLSAAYPPPPAPRPAPAATAPTCSTTTAPALPWGRSWDGGVMLARQCAKVAGTAEGGRNAALHAAACAVYGFAHMSPLIVRNAEADLLGAGRACGLDERESLAAIRSGATWGRANPCTPSFGVIDDDIDIDGAAVNRADAAAALARLRPSMGELAHLHPRRRVTVLRIVGTLTASVVQTGRRVVVANVDDIAKAADVGRKAIAAAADDCGALGWTWQPGDAVERRAGRWTWGVALTVTMPHGRDIDGARHDENTGGIVSESAAVSVATPIGTVPDVLPLALRRAVVRSADGSRQLAPRARTGEPPAVQSVPLDRLAACGQWAAEAVAIVKAKPDGATGEAVGDALGISERSARRVLARCDARGILTSSPAPSTGGRPRLVYRYAPDDAALDAEHAVGARVYAKAVESARARADRLADARVEAAETCDALAVVLARRRAEDGRRAAAERRAAAGGDLGRVQPQDRAGRAERMDWEAAAQAFYRGTLPAMAAAS